MTMCPPDQPLLRTSIPSPTQISGSTSSRLIPGAPLTAAPLEAANRTSRAFASLTNAGSRSRPWRMSLHRSKVRNKILIYGEVPGNLKEQVSGAHGWIDNRRD